MNWEHPWRDGIELDTFTGPFQPILLSESTEKEGENFHTSVVCGLVVFVVVYFLFEAVPAILKKQRSGCERGIPYL